MDNAKFVERVRDLCKEQKTSITKLAAQLDFSNGYIGKWAKRPSSPPYEKLTSIAQALGVTVEELTGEEPAQKEKPTPSEESELDADVKAKAYTILDKLRKLPTKQQEAFLNSLDISIDAALNMMDGNGNG